MGWKKNPFTGKLDYYEGTADLNDDYVNVVGDTMTGALIVTPTGGTVAITSNLDLKVKAGQKLILDGG